MFHKFPSSVYIIYISFNLTILFRHGYELEVSFITQTKLREWTNIDGKMHSVAVKCVSDRVMEVTSVLCFSGIINFHKIKKMGVSTVNELKQSVSGKKTFKSSSSTRQAANQWYTYLHFLLHFYFLFISLVFFCHYQISMINYALCSN